MMFLLFYISLWNSYKQSIKTTLSSTISSTLEKNALDQCLCVWSMYQNKVQKQCFLQKDGLLTRWEWVLGESTFLQSIKQPHWPSHSIIQITQLHQTRQKPKKKKKPLYSTQYSDSIFLHLIFHELQSSDLKGSSPYASESTLFSFFLSEDSPGAVQSGIQVPTTYNMLWG